VIAGTLTGVALNRRDQHHQYQRGSERSAIDRVDCWTR